jgi:hypothetical protein
VLVKEWQLTCSMFDGDQLLGPVPTLFAENVEVKILFQNKYSEKKEKEKSLYIKHTGKS